MRCSSSSPIPARRKLRRHRQARQLRRPLLAEGIKRSGTHHHAVVLHEHETLDLLFQQLAVTAHEGTVGLHRRDERDERRHVLGPRVAETEDRIARHQRSHAGMGEEFEQEAAVEIAVDEMRPPHATADRLERMRQVEVQILR